ncbi:hypothetical protein PG996_004254 [Apiospora saccharicola]|uniref:Phospholipase/carboxylesterase/thioesterase domain-containing protein n=1 Tax=Apiospora saccharicola TaxID=335842 RepID=A0ABR1W3L5_9PEZI
MDYPAPLVVPPLSLPHQRTFVILHGRGSSAVAFGPPLLDTPISPIKATSPSSLEPTRSEVQSLATAFPHARFVFPSAPRRRATLYKRGLTHQWFDSWDLEPPAIEREELQDPGLRETTAYLHQLLRAEIDLVPGGAKNVVFGGLSQGCAASLDALLLWVGEPLGAFMGMAGWFPYAYRLSGLSRTVTEEEDDAFNPFQRDEDDEDGTPNEARIPVRPIDEAATWLREQIELDTGETTASKGHVPDMTPLFLGHGTLDDKVNIVLGRQARDTLTEPGLHVTWMEYEGLGHWYSNNMLRDLADFLSSDSAEDTRE